jgi:pimeloyl-ACP methyl ester carboxylesterase
MLISVKPPGRLVDIGTHRLHLHCAGEGSPTVVLDAALGASSLSWTLVQPAIARATRTCAYDRAGFGWSDAGPLPRTAGRVADELFTLLRRAEVPGPYVLVGHSFGGLVARLFTHRHRADVAGLVLIEPAIPEEWANPSSEQRALISRGRRLCGYGQIAARSGLARVVAALVRIGALAPARALVRAISRGGLQRADEGILAPIWKLPPETRRILGGMWAQPKFFEALGSQIETICDSASEVMRLPTSDLADLPLVLITSADAGTRRLDADAAMARMSRRGQHVLAPRSGHWVPLDAPDVVVDALVALVTRLRPTDRSPDGGV